MATKKPVPMDQDVLSHKRIQDTINELMEKAREYTRSLESMNAALEKLVKDHQQGIASIEQVKLAQFANDEKLKILQSLLD